MAYLKTLAKQRKRRRHRVRNGIRRSSSGRARLSIHRSNRHISVQLIDDVKRVTIASASSLEPEVAGPGNYGGNKATAEKVGKLIAERAKDKGVTEVVFDRGLYKYHGRVQALADAAREAGLDFWSFATNDRSSDHCALTSKGLTDHSFHFSIRPRNI